MLRVFCLWALPTDEALAMLERDRAEYVRHLAQIETSLTTKDWAKNPTSRASRLTIEFGRRFYATQIEWIDWASAEVVASTLEPGGPLPGGDPPVTPDPRGRAHGARRRRPDAEPAR